MIRKKKLIFILSFLFDSKPPFDIHDIIYIYEELWHGKSILTGPQDRLTLARWDRTKPMTVLNAVCMSRDEARAHDALEPNTDLRKHYGDGKLLIYLHI